MNEHILVVEDEERLALVLSKYLMASYFQVSILNEGTGVEGWVREHKPDLILLDIMLPGRSGLDICKEIRLFSNVPIIMVTALVEDIDRLLGLELGADDYVCKPFSPAEVVARVKAVLRRASHDWRKFQARGLTLDEDGYRATIHGHDLDLSVVEFKLLQLLAGHPGRILNRTQIMERIYHDDHFVSERTIDSHIRKLRRKIEAADPTVKLIHSVYSAGYKFEKEPRETA
jgi:two-component system, OmpR family, response regulator BaeR